MKTNKMAKRDLEFLKWKIWEPLRRNNFYIKSWQELLTSRFLNPELTSSFCQKFRLSAPISPGTKFEDIHAHDAPWPVNPFAEHYSSPSDAAAFVDFIKMVTRGQFLTIWVDTSFSKNMIECELRKIFNEWLKLRSFYGIKRKHIDSEAALFQSGKKGRHLKLTLDLSASRVAILAGMERVLQGIKAKNKISAPRLQVEKWAVAYRAYDLAQREFSSERIAEKLGIPRANTVTRMILRADAEVRKFDLIKGRRKRRVPYNAMRHSKNQVSETQQCHRCKKPTARHLCPQCEKAFRKFMEGTEAKYLQLLGQLGPI